MTQNEKYDVLCYIEDILEIYKGSDVSSAELHSKAQRFVNGELLALRKEMKLARKAQDAIM